MFFNPIMKPGGILTENSLYRQQFNRCQGRVGHLFRGRYRAIVRENERHLLEVCRYLVPNPVRAGIVRDAWEPP